MADRNLLFFRSLPTSLSDLQTAIQNGVLFSGSSITSIKYLDIAITLPFPTNSISRRQTFAQVSSIVNRIYSLSEGHNDEIEVNVIVLHDDYNACGGIIRHWSDLRRLSEVRRWVHILSIEDVDDLFGPNCKNAIVFESESPNSVRQEWWEAPNEKQWGERKEHDVSCVGGTFDYLHAGHKLLLTMTAYMIPSASPSPKIIIGLTGAELLKNKKHKEYVASWETRCDNTVSFLRTIIGDPVGKSEGSGMQTETESDLPTSSRIRKFQLSPPVGNKISLEMHEIQDAFGPTITLESVSCLVVSEETKGGGDMINEKRKEKGWAELEVFTVGLVGGDGSVEGKLSSTEFRRKRAEKSR